MPAGPWRWSAGREGTSRSTARQLHEHGLASVVDLVHAPLAPVRLDDLTVTCYDPAVVHGAVAACPPGFILVDGPSQQSGSNRVATLPTVRSALREPARFLLDDGWREAELAVVRHWVGTDGICVEGIVPVGKGAWIGSVEPDR